MPTGPAANFTEKSLPQLRQFATHPEWTRRGVGKAIWRRILSDVAVAMGSVTELEVFSSRTAEDFYASASKLFSQTRGASVSEDYMFTVIPHATAQP
jgi:N-acetylglutamate synthase-like GNAT family acetyltransferase